MCFLSRPGRLFSFGGRELKAAAVFARCVSPLLLFVQSRSRFTGTLCAGLPGLPVLFFWSPLHPGLSVHAGAEAWFVFHTEGAPAASSNSHILETQHIHAETHAGAMGHSHYLRSYHVTCGRKVMPTFNSLTTQQQNSPFSELLSLFGPLEEHIRRVAVSLKQCTIFLRKANTVCHSSRRVPPAVQTDIRAVCFLAQNWCSSSCPRKLIVVADHVWV